MRRGVWTGAFALAALLAWGAKSAVAGPALPVEPLAFPPGLDIFAPAPIPTMVGAPLPTELHGHLKDGVTCDGLVAQLVVPPQPRLPPFTDANGTPLRLPAAPETPEFPPSNDTGWEFDGTVWICESFVATFVRGERFWQVESLGIDVEYDAGRWSVDGFGSSWNVTEDTIEYDDLSQNWTIQADGWSYENLAQSWDVGRDGWSYEDLPSSWELRDGVATYSSIAVDAEIRADGWTYSDLFQDWDVTSSGWDLAATWPILPEKYPLGMNVTASYDGATWEIVTPLGTCTSAKSAPGAGPGASIALLVALAGAASRRRRGDV